METFARKVAFVVLKSIIFTSIAVIVIITGHTTADKIGVPSEGPESGHSATVDPAPVVQSPAHLIEANDCWTGEAPADMAGEIPGHVVYAAGADPKVGGAKMVGKAFGQIFEGEAHGLTIYGFCR